MDRREDTIAALATAPGEGGVAIVRISGDRAREILSRAFLPAQKRKITPRRLTYGSLVSETGEVLDEVMAVFLPAPHTYTRQDVAEIHCHGGRAAVESTLSRVCELGARPAEPGEFTLRAFLGGRIDLSQAEGVMSIISAGGRAAQRAGMRQLTGGVSRQIARIRDRLTALLAQIEAADDFPEEIDEAATAQEVREGCEEIRLDLARCADERNARMVREGVSVVLCGKPNVGKSSLMNALLGSERAIVTHVPGTTRDVLTERMTIAGRTVELSDTAGQRETDDPVEAIGVQRAKKSQREADISLIVLDGSVPLTAEDEALLAQADERSLIVVNKAYLPRAFDPPEGAISLSAATGEGVETLREALSARISGSAPEDDCLTVQRHIDRARGAQAALARAVQAIDTGVPLDVAAVELWEARRELGEITGDDASEAVVSEIFASFCVGK